MRVPASPLPTSCPPGVPLPRLLSLKDGARYMGVSPWVVRQFMDSGALPRVRLTLPGGAEIRKVLLDVRDLDQLVDRSREGHQERRNTGP